MPAPGAVPQSRLPQSWPAVLEPTLTATWALQEVPRRGCPLGVLCQHPPGSSPREGPQGALSPRREEPVCKFTGKAAPAEVLEALCRERASFERAAEPLHPQARALLALQWGLLSTPRQK